MKEFEIEEDERITEIKSIMYANKGDIPLEELDELEKRVINMIETSSYGEFRLQLKWLRNDIRKKYLWMRYKKGREKKNQYSPRTRDLLINKYGSKKQKEEFTIDNLLQ